MIDTDELRSIKYLYYSYENKYRKNTVTCEVQYVAAIATIVDLVRQEIKSVQPIAKEEEKEIPIVPLSVLERTEPILYSALFAIGCERLNDITGYREPGKYTKDIEVMIKGRFAALSGKIGSGDMMTLSRLMRENGLPFVRWSE